MFEELANVAQEVVFDNNYDDSVMIINGKSTDLNVTELPVIPDVIISELLDSALLGESCIPSHSDAIQRLLNRSIDDQIPMYERVIPSEGVIFATLMESEKLQSLRIPPTISTTSVNVLCFRSDEEESCNGGTPLLPIHWDSLNNQSQSKTLSDATPILQFNFWNSFDNFIEVLEEDYEFGEGSYATDVVVTDTGNLQGILLWWTLYLLPSQLDPNRDHRYSTKPGEQNWQDHWQQTVCPLSKTIHCHKGDIVRIHSYHNSTRIMLTAHPLTNTIESEQLKKQKVLNEITKLDYPSRFIPSQCICGWHLLCDSDRLLMLNDANRKNLWINSIEKVIDDILLKNDNINENNKYILDLSDGSLFSLYMSVLLKNQKVNNCVKVVSRELKFFSRLFHGQLAERNSVDDMMMLWNGEDLRDVMDFFSTNEEEEEDDNEDEVSDTDEKKIDIVLLFSECFYYQLRSLPTWEALSFHYQRTCFNNCLLPSAAIIPCKAFVMAAAFELTDLYISHGEAGRWYH